MIEILKVYGKIQMVVLQIIYHHEPNGGNIENCVEIRNNFNGF